MARKPNVQNLLSSLLKQIGGEVARGVVQGIEHSGLVRKIKAVTKSTSKSTKSTTRGRKKGTKKKMPATCSARGCREPARTKGLCTKHYQQKRYAELNKKKGPAQKKAPKKTGKKKALKKAATKARSSKTTKRKAGRKKVALKKGTCKIAGCTNPVHARELCGRHFMEWVRSKKD